MENKKRILGEYVSHLLFGAFMFAALLLFSAAISSLVHWITPFVNDEFFSILMKFVERVILVADVIFLVFWSLYSTYRAVKEMLHE